MRKLLLLMAAAMMSVMLMSTTAFAAPLVNSATEPSIELEEPDVPLAELPEDEPSVEIDDPDVPLVSPQTGVTALSGTECAALLAAAFAVSGTALLAKARKQAR